MLCPHLYRTEHSETHTTNGDYGKFYTDSHSEKIAIQPKLVQIMKHIDLNRKIFVEHLKNAIKIRSISSNVAYLEQVDKMIDFVEKWFVRLNINFERYNNGFGEVNGQQVHLPYIIKGSLESNINKKTICVYCALDVSDPDMEEWKTDPWSITDLDNIWYGNGVASTKRTLMSWLLAVLSFQECSIELPVNLKFIVEGLYHCGHKGLSTFVELHKQDFFYDVDNIVICESEWLNDRHPCLIYGTVGVIHFDLFVKRAENSEKCVKEEIEKLCAGILDDEGQIQIPHLNDLVQQITPDEEKIYETIRGFDINEVKPNLPQAQQNWDHVKLLMAQWRLPSFWIGDIQECICDNKDKNIVKKHLMLKIVPSQMISKCINLVQKYFKDAVKQLNITNDVCCEYIGSTRYWLEKVTNLQYVAASRAIIQIFKKPPNFIREDRASRLIEIFNRVLEIPILVMPLTSSSSNYGRSNEHVTKENYFENIKLLAAYLFQYDIVSKCMAHKKKYESS